MISTEVNILDCIQLSDQEVDDITQAAKKDCEIKLNNLLDDFDILDYQISFDLVCKVNIIRKK
jgi:hypothetical protein